MSKYGAFYHKIDRTFSCKQTGCNYSIGIKPGGSTNSLRHHLKFSHPEVDLPPSERKRVSAKFYENQVQIKDEEDVEEKKVRLGDLADLTGVGIENQANENGFPSIPAGFEWDNIGLNPLKPEPCHSQEVVNETVIKPGKPMKRGANKGIRHPTSNGAIDRFEENVLNMIVNSTLDFRMIDNAGFKSFAFGLSTPTKIRSGRYYRDVILPRVYRRIMDKIAAELAETDVVSLSIECYCVQDDVSKLFAVNAHFSGKMWKPTSRILHVGVAKNNGEVKDQLKEVISKYHLEKKLHLVVRTDDLEGCPEGCNANSVFNFGEIINQAILTAVDVPSMICLIERVRKIVIGLKKVEIFDDFLFAHPETYDISFPTALKNCSLDWSYIYDLLRVFYDNRPSTKEKIEDGGVSKDELDEIKDLINIFEAIKTATIMDNITIGHIIPIFKLIEKKLMASPEEGLRTVKEMIVTGIRDGLGDYINNKYLTLSTLLHPRFKASLFSTSVLGSCSSTLISETLNYWIRKRSAPKTDIFLELISSMNDNNIEDTSKLKEEITAELKLYLSEPVKIQQAHEYWNDLSNKERFIKIRPLALRYLSSPAMPSNKEWTKTMSLVDRRMLNVYDEEDLSKMILIRHNLNQTGVFEGL